MRLKKKRQKILLIKKASNLQILTNKTQDLSILSEFFGISSCFILQHSANCQTRAEDSIEIEKRNFGNTQISQWGRVLSKCE